MNRIIDSLNFQYAHTPEKTVNNFRFSLNMSLLNFILNDEEECNRLFQIALHSLNYASSLSLQTGLVQVAYMAKLYYKKYNSYSEFNEQLDKLLLNEFSVIVNNFELSFRTIDAMNSELSLARYLLQNEIGFELVEFYCESIFEQISFRGVESIYCTKKDVELIEEKKISFPNGYLDLGVAHGIAGTLFFFSDALASGIKVAKEIIDLFLEVYSNNVFEATGLIPTILELDEKGELCELSEEIDLSGNALHWCYGTLGVLNSLNYVEKKYSSKELSDLINIVCSKITHYFKQPLSENLLFCHGCIGTFVIQKKLFNTVPNEKNILLFRSKLDVLNFDSLDDFPDNSLVNYYSIYGGLISIPLGMAFVNEETEMEPYTRSTLESIFLI